MRLRSDIGDGYEIWICTHSISGISHLSFYREHVTQTFNYGYDLPLAHTYTNNLWLPLMDRQHKQQLSSVNSKRISSLKQRALLWRCHTRVVMWLVIGTRKGHSPDSANPRGRYKCKRILVGGPALACVIICLHDQSTATMTCQRPT